MRVSLLGPDYTQEARTLFGRMTVAPTSARRAVCDQLIRTLKSSGVWDRLGVLYVTAAHDSTIASLLNWKNPGTYTLTVSGSPTFTEDRGYTGDGAAAFLDAGVAPTALTECSQDSIHMGGWILTDIANNNGYLIGLQTNGTSYVRPRTAANVFSSRINDATNTTGSVTDSRGHYVMNRSGASARQWYRNATSLGTDSTASTGFAAVNIGILKANSAFSTHQVAAAHVGASLTSDQVSALYNALRIYLTALGAV